MKKRKSSFLKKTMALLLGAVLLSGTCAYAEEAAGIAHSHKLSDLYLVSGEQVIDLTSVSAELDISGEDKADAGCLHVDVDGETVAEIGVAKVDGLYVYHFDSATLGHKDYVIDPVVFLARYLDQGIDGLIGLLEKVDTTGMAQGILDYLDRLGEAPLEPEKETEETEAPQEPEQKRPEISLKGDVVSVLMDCISGPESVQMDGEVNLADGTYTSTEFNCDTETLCEILDMIYVDGEPSGWGDKVREAGVEFLLHGSSLKGEEEGLNEVSSFNMQFDDGRTNVTLEAGANKSYTEDGSVTAVSFGETVGEQAIGLSFNLSDGTHEGEAFSADSIDMENAIVLTEMENEEAAKELREAAGTVMSDVMGAIVGPVMSSMLMGASTETSAEAEEALQIPCFTCPLCGTEIAVGEDTWEQTDSESIIKVTCPQGHVYYTDLQTDAWNESLEDLQAAQ